MILTRVVLYYSHGEEVQGCEYARIAKMGAAQLIEVLAMQDLAPLFVDALFGPVDEQLLDFEPLAATQAVLCLNHDFSRLHTHVWKVAIARYLAPVEAFCCNFPAREITLDELFILCTNMRAALYDDQYKYNGLEREGDAEAPTRHRWRINMVQDAKARIDWLCIQAGGPHVELTDNEQWHQEDVRVCSDTDCANGCVTLEGINVSSDMIVPQIYRCQLLCHGFFMVLWTDDGIQGVGIVDSGALDLQLSPDFVSIAG